MVNKDPLRRDNVNSKPQNKQDIPQQTQLETKISNKAVEGRGVPSVHVIWDSTGLANCATIKYPAQKRSSETFVSSDSECNILSQVNNLPGYYIIAGSTDRGDNEANRSAKVQLQIIGEEVPKETSKKSVKFSQLSSCPTSYPSVQERGFIAKQLKDMIVAPAETAESKVTQKAITGSNNEAASKQRISSLKPKKNIVGSDATETSSNSSRESAHIPPYKAIPSKSKRRPSTVGSSVTPKRPPSPERGRTHSSLNRSSTSAESNRSTSFQCTNSGAWKVQNNPKTPKETRNRYKPCSHQKQDKNSQTKSSKPTPIKRDGPNESNKLRHSNHPPEYKSEINSPIDKVKKEMMAAAAAGKKRDLSRKSGPKSHYEIESVRIKRPTTNEHGIIEEAAEIHIRPIQGTKDTQEDRQELNNKDRIVTESPKEIIRISIARNDEPIEILTHETGGIEISTEEVKNNLSSLTSNKSEKEATEILGNILETVEHKSVSQKKSEKSTNNSDVGVQVSLGEIQSSGKKSPTDVSEIGVQVSIANLKRLRNQPNTSSSKYSTDLSTTCMQFSVAETNNPELPILKSPLNISAKLSESPKPYVNSEHSPNYPQDTDKKELELGIYKNTDILGNNSGSSFKRSLKTSNSADTSDKEDLLENFSDRSSHSTLKSTDYSELYNFLKHTKKTSTKSLMSSSKAESVNSSAKGSMLEETIETTKVTPMKSPSKASEYTIKQKLDKISDYYTRVVPSLPINSQEKYKLHSGNKSDTCPGSDISTSSVRNTKEEGRISSMETKDIRLENRLNMLENRLKLEELRNRSWISRVTQAEDRLLRLSSQFRELESTVNSLHGSPPRSNEGSLKSLATTSVPNDNPVSLKGLKNLIQQLREEIDGTQKLSTDNSRANQRLPQIATCCVTPYVTNRCQDASASPTTY